MDLYTLLKDRPLTVTGDGWITDQFFALPLSNPVVERLFEEFNLLKPEPGRYTVGRSITPDKVVPKAAAVGELATPDLSTYRPAVLAKVNNHPIRVLLNDECVFLLGLTDPVVLAERLWQICDVTTAGDPYVRNGTSPVYWVRDGSVVAMAMPIRLTGGTTDFTAVLALNDV